MPAQTGAGIQDEGGDPDENHTGGYGPPGANTAERGMRQWGLKYNENTYSITKRREIPMVDYEMFCPICGKKMTIPNNSKVRCHNEKCNTFLTLQEQYHTGGFLITVRFEP